MQLNFDNITTDRLILNQRTVTILRLDKLHPVISGNKWFKLQHYLRDAKSMKKKRIVTFGGPWSNHIVATAAACKSEGFLSTGIIRGEEPEVLSHTLTEARSYGMQLHFITRHDYREDRIPLQLGSDENYVIPQGGYGPLGAAGASAILEYYNEPFTHCCCAVGTGTMMAGLINAGPAAHVIGISALKNNHELQDQISALVRNPSKQWQLIHDYHFGGYAKYTDELLTFMNGFYRETHIPSDFVYTGKLFFAIADLIEKNFFPVDSHILVIHSGGLQGNESLGKGKLIY